MGKARARRPSTPAGKSSLSANWHVYIVRCADGTLYTGIAIDVEQRCETHNRGRGARYTRSRLPVRVVYVESSASRGDALRREYAIKALPRRDKQRLVRGRATKRTTLVTRSAAQ
ncbi:MAG: GIY-YIG nuclease family protein [Phycisphaerae bacterium]